MIGVTRKGKTPLSDKISESEAQVEVLCEFLGYGRVMQIASEKWQGKDQDGAFLIGTCAGLTEPCGCKPESRCDWCAGTGWLTKKVKAIKDSQ
ncbi:MAG: hypothetical protein HRU38_23420 [Saccharospirillaceae bacterium]|nr:hypothetical protein [Saccharospirillaceae bacterium]